jgi:hypothetical protein
MIDFFERKARMEYSEVGIKKIIKGSVYIIIHKYIIPGSI